MMPSMKSCSITLACILCTLYQGCATGKAALSACERSDKPIKADCICGDDETCRMGQICPADKNATCTGTPNCTKGDEEIKTECMCEGNKCNVGQKCLKDAKDCSSDVPVSSTPNNLQAMELAFVTFQDSFDKKYDVVSGEQEKRKKIFMENLKFINDFNSDKTNTVTLGVGPFADLSREEFKEFVSRGKFDVDNDSQWGDLPKLGTVKSMDENDLPKSINWVAKGAVTHVKDQGLCGSCWTFATTGALEGHLFKTTGKLTELSEQMLLDCDKEEHRCDGGHPVRAFLFVEKYGICTEDGYPYKCIDNKSPACKKSMCHSCTGNIGIRPKEIVGVYSVHHETTALMTSLTFGPVSVSIEADSDVFQHYTGRVVTSANCGQKLGHAVLAVGYGEEADGTKYWLVKNSWGSKWGVSGYVKIGRGIQEGTGGECGILKLAAFPVLKDEEELAKGSHPFIEKNPELIIV